MYEPEDDVDIFIRPLRDDMDIYSDWAIDKMVDNSEITPEEAAFMAGYNEAQ
ncbi:hypothetical protein JXB31_04530 [Candidatus Woesearchaeota archaeon]|nr:hypothetical protein [Candidatus Woesearchaeota archaeon]